MKKKEFNEEYVLDVMESKIEKFSEELEGVYRQLNWTWHTGTTPTKNEIASTTRDLIHSFFKDEKSIKSLFRCGSYPISTGGIEVLFEYNQSYEGALDVSVRFIKEEIEYENVKNFNNLNKYIKPWSFKKEVDRIKKEKRYV